MSDSEEEVLKKIGAATPPAELKAAPKTKDGRARPRSKAQIEATKRLVESTRLRRAKSADEKEKVLRAKYAPVKRREVVESDDSSGSEESSSGDEPPPPRNPSRKKAVVRKPRRGQPVIHNYYYGWSGQHQRAPTAPVPSPVDVQKAGKQVEEPKPKAAPPPKPTLRFV